MKLLFLLVTSFALTCAKYTGPTNQAGLDLIKEFEGWMPDFYSDPVGIKTIGYGHGCHVFDCSVPLMGLYTPPLTKAEGEAILKSDLKAGGGYESCVANAVKYGDLNANQYSALVSFTFNLGCGNLQSSTLLQLLNGGNTQGASEEFAKWVYAGGQILPGLVRRREAERKLFCSSGGCSGGGGGGCTGTVTADSLIVRQSPNTGAAQVGSLFNGDHVTIVGRTTGTVVSGNPNWFQISTGGYVTAVYISASGSASWCSSN